MPKIKYVITGTARRATITYLNATGGIEQVDAYLPWVREEFFSSASVSLTAQKKEEAGTITCEIWHGNDRLKTSTSTAAYGVVTCADFIIN